MQRKYFSFLLFERLPLKSCQEDYWPKDQILLSKGLEQPEVLQKRQGLCLNGQGLCQIKIHFFLLAFLTARSTAVSIPLLAVLFLSPPEWQPQGKDFAVHCSVLFPQCLELWLVYKEVSAE